eukprot:475126_1
MGNDVQGSGASRSVNVRFKNNTKFTLYRDGCSTSEGIWTTYPPKSISPHSEVRWMSESQSFMRGTEARVFYKADGHRFKLWWQNEYVGSNTSGCNIPKMAKRFSVSERKIGSSNNTYAYFTLEYKEPPKKKKIEIVVVKPKLEHYEISQMKWYTRPLKNLAKHIGGKHSATWVKFDLNNKKYLAEMPKNTEYKLYYPGPSLFTWPHSVSFFVERTRTKSIQYGSCSDIQNRKVYKNVPSKKKKKY